MTPEYLRELANIADPDKLWRLNPFDQRDLPKEKRDQVNTGVALRRHAAHIERLNALMKEKKSLLITPLATNVSATKSIETPPDHEKLRRSPSAILGANES